jgi:hypothetical protein
MDALFVQSFIICAVCAAVVWHLSTSNEYKRARSAAQASNPMVFAAMLASLAVLNIVAAMHARDVVMEVVKRAMR